MKPFHLRVPRYPRSVADEYDGYLRDYRTLATISARRLETLRYLSHGLTARQTADAMTVEYDTVIKHMKAARRELGAKTTAHAVAVALRLGLID